MFKPGGVPESFNEFASAGVYDIWQDEGGFSFFVITSIHREKSL